MTESQQHLINSFNAGVAARAANEPTPSPPNSADAQAFVWGYAQEGLRLEKQIMNLA